MSRIIIISGTKLELEHILRTEKFNNIRWETFTVTNTQMGLVYTVVVEA